MLQQPRRLPLRLEHLDRLSVERNQRVPRRAPLQVLRLQARVLCDPGQHLRTDFLVLVEAEHVIAALGMVQLNVGATLGYYGPTFSEESG